MIFETRMVLPRKKRKRQRPVKTESGEEKEKKKRKSWLKLAGGKI